METNYIGLPKKEANQLSEELDNLLANYSIFYQNVRGFHWHIKGNNFFELHLKFEELYTDLLEKIDEIAERILTLGSQPNHNFSNYLKLSEIKETKLISNDNEAVETILNSFSILLKKQRSLLNLSNEIDDEGTSALLSDYIREQEKLVWMYSSFLN